MKKLVEETLFEFDMGTTTRLATFGDEVGGPIIDKFFGGDNEGEGDEYSEGEGDIDTECCDTDRELVRKGIIAELQAIDQYEELARQAKSEKIRKVFLDIAKEEKTHAGEFQALLLEIDPEFGVELQNGAEEVEKNS